MHWDLILDSFKEDTLAEALHGSPRIYTHVQGCCWRKNSPFSTQVFSCFLKLFFFSPQEKFMLPWTFDWVQCICAIRLIYWDFCFHSFIHSFIQTYIKNSFFYLNWIKCNNIIITIIIFFIVIFYGSHYMPWSVWGPNQISRFSYEKQAEKCICTPGYNHSTVKKQHINYSHFFINK